ncbi:hypothetical protein N7466_002981 [Penicillium verhagenii]|uniref:uncharacterized protein n=1 Tax=Penicillium verhagenii TaxID=1562060 RepID=UPI002545350C|nr:uncharacterized protein N7466_002981 [Penicillium verhagenii]KAJ5936531.1 hypothetical protein N7466_002981 [Penicillium verhagenii]
MSTSARFTWLNPGLSAGPSDGKESPQHQEDIKLSPKQPAEAEGGYSLSDFLYNFQQNDLCCQAPYIPQHHYQPRSNTKIIPDTGTGASSSLYHPGLTYETKYEPSDDYWSGVTFADTNTEGKDDTSVETERFRFRTILQAPTAMIDESGDPLLSYLNKAQIYYLTVMDTAPPATTEKVTTYRTFIRATFDQEQARSNPAACWQLWKEGRGVYPEQQQEETLFAVEYAGGDSSQFQIELRGFDGFSMTWSIDSTARFSSCHIPICFNFLSTDFIRSRGVRGVPVRLCAKTEQVTVDHMTPSLTTLESEVCFCKIQVFRDHGAERKLSNDHTNLEKAIEKLRQRISHAELGWGSRKRKRGKSISSAKGLKKSPPDDKSHHLSQTGLRSKLVGFEKMALSGRSTTLLSLRGDKEDDPDLYPVRLDDGYIKAPVEIAAGASTWSEYSERVSPRRFSLSNKDTTATPPAAGRLPVEPIKVNRVDLTDQVPASRHLNSVACFHVRRLENELHEYYRAIYLSERKIQELARKIFDKYQIKAMDSVNLFHIDQKGLKIMVDDEFVQQMTEGQQMTIDVHQSTDQGDCAGKKGSNNETEERSSVTLPVAQDGQAEQKRRRKKTSEALDDADNGLPLPEMPIEEKTQTRSGRLRKKPRLLKGFEIDKL